ncbi:hypothetical protein RIF29_24474 [Crotalaria pallida]|uniref:C2H2-type domain-containing protein n=1 Tax=Crotalaria pallida TaxID=3830 RepID=A0AAN9EPZ8_CROPI
MSNITSCDSGSFSTENNNGEEAAGKKQPGIVGQFHSSNSHTSTITNTNSNGSNSNSQSAPSVNKKKRNLPGNPDPSAEVIALSPNTLVTTNRFICEICNKGFQRDQNLQLHRRGHNLPWKLKQRSSTQVIKRVYVCPEPSCVHHNPARALGDLTGIKKHFSRKHGEKKWKCDKCSKKYAVQSDWKAHSKVCGTKEYKCDCGTIFNRRDSFITHRAFCDALAEENSKVNGSQLSNLDNNNSNLQGQVPIPIPILVAPPLPIINTNNQSQLHPLSSSSSSSLPHHQDLIPSTMPNTTTKPFNMLLNSSDHPSLQASSNSPNMLGENEHHNNNDNLAAAGSSPHMSATALLQKAAQLGTTVTEKSNYVTSMAPPTFGTEVNHYVHISSSQYNFHNNNNGNDEMNGDMFNAILLDQSKALSKIIEQNNRSSNVNTISGGSTKGSEGVMTLDLLGIGGSGGVANGNFYGGVQQSEKAATDEVWRNWSTNNAGLESFSATGSL